MEAYFVLGRDLEGDFLESLEKLIHQVAYEGFVKKIKSSFGYPINAGRVLVKEESTKTI